MSSCDDSGPEMPMILVENKKNKKKNKQTKAKMSDDAVAVAVAVAPAPVAPVAAREKTVLPPAMTKWYVAGMEKVTYVGAGVILMRMDMEEPRVLLLQGVGAGVWSFSKGHPEVADDGDPYQTAIRETFEETGFVAERDYHILPDRWFRMGKRAYWLGIMKPTTSTVPELAEEEHVTHGWFSVSEAAALTWCNTDVRAWIKKAYTPKSQFSQIMRNLRLRSHDFAPIWPTHLCAPGCIES